MEINDFLEHREEDSQNIAHIKEFYRASMMGDKIALSELLVDEPTWNVCPGFPEGGVHRGMAEVFGTMYPNMRKHFHYLPWWAEPEVFIDVGDIVTALGFYKIVIKEGDPPLPVRFSHTWKIAPDGRIGGVWQVADSHVIQEALKAE